MNTHRSILPLFFALAVATSGAFADDSGRTPVSVQTTPAGALHHYTITQPGSYYLEANVVGTNKSGILISSGGVTLDLNGFSVTGSDQGPGFAVGIEVTAVDGPVRISNGTIRYWKSNGIHAQAASFELDSVRLSDNGGHGLYCVGGSALVTRCVAEENAWIGFNLSANGSGPSGGARIFDSVSRYNGQSGFKGGSVESSTAYRNDEDGIRYAEHVVVCTVQENGRHGIVVKDRARVTGNSVTGSGRLVPYSAGILVEGHGSLITGNECSNNNSRGMQVNGSRNRIEENHFTDNRSIGLWVYGQYNIIVRNTARNPDGVNWSINQWNRAGAFVAPTAIPQAVNGATGGPGSGTTDPFANLSF